MDSKYLALNTSENDHSVTLTISGEVESLRPRLSEALQKLGYTVLGEQPLYAKRAAQGGARWDCSFEVIDYPTKLTISLKQINDFAIVASFNYEVQSYHSMTKGDRQTLLREAEAIAALASERLALSACPACATSIVDDSHFCRRCGTPLVVEVSELEVLRLTRASRTAHHNLVLGVVILLLASLLFLPLFWVGPKPFWAFLLFGSAFGVFGLVALLQGIWQLHFALNPKSSPKAIAQPAPTFTAPLTQVLPAPPAHASVTEGTTELLVSNKEDNQRRASEPVPRKVLDTGEVDDERLM